MQPIYPAVEISDGEHVQLSVPEAAFNPDALGAIASAHLGAGRLMEAIYCYEQAMKRKPDDPRILNGLGFAHHQAGREDLALKCYQLALEIRPDDPGTLCNLGYLTVEMGFPENARRLFLRALELDPGNGMAKMNLAISYLTSQEFGRAWPLVEARFEAKPRIAVPRRYAGMKRWDGGPCRRLALWREPGLGDEVLYSSLLPSLLDFSALHGFELRLEVSTRLLPIIQRSFPEIECVPFDPSGKVFEGCDAHAPMMDVAKFLRRERFDFFKTQRAAFLKPDAARVESIRHELRISRPVAAISWKSIQKARPFMERKKSAPVSAFNAFDEYFDVVSAQYGLSSDEIESVMMDAPALSILPNLDTMNDLEGVLALLASVDIVITTCNVTAHFAGALGKRTLLLYRAANPPCWYWQPYKSHCLWYPSVEIVTAKEATTWDDVVQLALQRL